MKPLIIFDCDGVLVDSEPIASAEFARHLAAIDISLTAQQCRDRFTGLSLASCRQWLEREMGRPLPADFFDRLQADTYRAFADRLQPVAGIAAVLAYLEAASWPFCVASSGSHEKMAVTLGCTGLRPHFANRVYSAMDVARGKPAPDLFLHAARYQGFAPAACIVVEDSPPGWQAATAAGMVLCAFIEPGSPSSPIPAWTVFTAMSELPAILSTLSERSPDE